MHDCSTCSRWAGPRGPSGRPGARGPAAPAFQRSPFREHSRRSERREWHISSLQPPEPVLGRAQGVVFLRQGKQDSSRRGQLMCQRKPTTTTPSLALLFLFLAFPTARETLSATSQEPLGKVPTRVAILLVNQEGKRQFWMANTCKISVLKRRYFVILRSD